MFHQNTPCIFTHLVTVHQNTQSRLTHYPEVSILTCYPKLTDKTDKYPEACTPNGVFSIDLVEVYKSCDGSKNNNV